MISTASGPSTVGLAIDRRLAGLPPDQAYDDRSAVARLVRQALLEAGLGRRDPQRPLADLIEPGMSVLLKPNWVLDRNLGPGGMAPMVTHPHFILAALDEALLARPGRVILGDAPIQACDFDGLLRNGLKQQAIELGRAAGASVEFADFRRTVWTPGQGGAAPQTEVGDPSRFVLFDLASDSLLEPISTPVGRFRVTNYDPRKLAQTHRPGRHQYLLCKEAFEADVLISLPKLKLHRKAGLTGALKNLVGLNGNKDYLPHHRRGGAAEGGDCYPGRSMAKWLVEMLLDAANRRLGTPGYQRWSFWASRSLARVSREEEGSLEGGWHGNDTCWRMVLDLNRILLYGRADGTLADQPRRTLWSLTDCIVCGEGEGPLSPSPLGVGAVTFSGCAPAADAVHAALLKLDPRRIPLIREAFGAFRWPLAGQFNLGAATLISAGACFDGTGWTTDAIAEQLGVEARAPKGWAGHVEWRSRVP